MAKYNYPSEAFYDLVDKMELTENMSCNAEKIDLCLGHRKFMLRKEFECSPENMARFGEVMLLLKRQNATIFNTTKTLYRQLHKQWQEGKTNYYSDFRVETHLEIEFNGDNPVEDLDDNTDSKYVKMAEPTKCYFTPTIPCKTLCA